MPLWKPFYDEVARNVLMFASRQFRPLGELAFEATGHFAGRALAGT